MKPISAYSVRFICLILLLALSTGCKKLDRDNPLDKNGGSSTNTTNGPDVKYSRYEVYSDNNGDGQINKGETVKLNVYLKNKGNSRAAKVRATISCSSSYVSSLSPVTAGSYYSNGLSDYMDPGIEGSVATSGGYLSFTVLNNTPNGTTLTFTLTITDEANHTWTDSFTVTVVATGANMGYSRYEVYSDNNTDGQINKGETVKLNVYLKNKGSSRANKVRATVSCPSSYISALSPVSAGSYYSNGLSDYIDAGIEGSVATSGGYLSFNVSNTTPAGTTITFTVTITDEANNAWTDSFTITVVATNAVMAYSMYDVYSDTNNDGQIDKGETVKLNVHLKNNGSSRANKVRATITCANSYISGLSPVTAVSYYSNGLSDYIDPGMEGTVATSGGYLSFSISSSTPTGTAIPFNIVITDESNNTWSDTFSITVH